MKILVTGGAGCVGKALKKIHKINDNQWFFIQRSDCDLVNREEVIKVFQDIRPTCVIHLASYVPGFYNIDKISSFSTNVRINENVLEASHLADTNRGIFCLSANMFSSKLSTFPLDETMIFDDALDGLFEGYSYSKRMLAMQCRNYNDQYGRKYFGIIPCNIFGPNDDFTSGRLIPNLIKKFSEAIKTDSDVVINGTGKPVRQFIYSLDLAKIIEWLAINYLATEPLICCANDEISIADLAYKIGKLLNFKKRIIFDETKPDGSLRRTIDNSRLKKIMGDKLEFTDLDLGLEETINSSKEIA